MRAPQGRAKHSPNSHKTQPLPPPSSPGLCTTSNQNHCDFLKENSNDTRKVTARHPTSITENKVKMSRGLFRNGDGHYAICQASIMLFKKPTGLSRYLRLLTTTLKILAQVFMKS